jgi:hypothetical protein
MERGDRDALHRIIADDYTTRNGAWNKAQYIEQAIKDKANDDINLKNATSVPLNYSVKFKRTIPRFDSHHPQLHPQYLRKTSRPFKKRSRQQSSPLPFNFVIHLTRCWFLSPKASGQYSVGKANAMSASRR